jgi:hypothetical protein
LMFWYASVFDIVKPRQLMAEEIMRKRVS